jgi:nitrite reductase (NADH) small subunit
VIEDFDVGAESDYGADDRKIMEIGGWSVGVFRSAGKFYAVQNLCPHALAPICIGELGATNLPSPPGQFIVGMEGRVLRCPWHGWEFDIETGEALFGIDRRRLQTYPVRVADGRVIVSMRPRTAPTGLRFDDAGIVRTRT